VHTQNICPKLFVSERVVPKDLTTSLDSAILMLACLAVRDRLMSRHGLESSLLREVRDRSPARGSSEARKTIATGTTKCNEYT